jgi:hypothetical protein
MAEIVRDLGNRYGSEGSVLVRHQGNWFVVSSTMNPDGSVETAAFPGNAHGGVTGWREVCGGYGLDRDQVMAALEDTCHCGAPLAGSDHCPSCGCEQYESYCDAVYDPGPVTDYLSDEELADINDRLRAELEG